MKDVTYNHEIDKDGNLVSWTIYPEREVVNMLHDKEVVLGVQPEYRVSNVVSKDNVPLLKEFLLEQLQLQRDKVKPSQDYIEQHGHLDPSGKVQDLLKQLTDKQLQKKFKDYPKLDKYAEMVVKLNEAKRNVELFERSCGVIQQHLDFIEKHF